MDVSYQLVNEHDQTLSLTLSNRAWYHLLELAEQHGWNPMGTIRPDWLAGLGSAARDGHEFEPYLQGSYTPDFGRQVMLEDALNLADALDQAFLVLEPRPMQYYPGMHQEEWDADGVLPGIGVIVAVIDLCREGTFWIEWC
jgi:hypothetical protein